MKNRFLIWFILLITVIAVFIDLPKSPIPQIKFHKDLKEGLDLAGGTRLVLKADMTKVNVVDRDQSLDSLKSIIERRVNLYGVSEPVVQTAKTSGDYRVIVELAGVTDVNEALALVGKTAELSFREEVTDASAAAKISSTSAALYGPFQKVSKLTGRDVKLAKPAFDPQTGRPIIELTFNAEGSKKWAKITTDNVGKRIGILIDGQFIMEPPVVQGPIPTGQTVISGNFTTAQTKNISTLLNSGALPAPVKVIEQRTIGASLGAESINQSILAGIIGLGIVAIFMIANYGKLGIYADLALIVYTLIVFAAFKLIPVTLTLAGIAGFILSIGMAVDANILIFERMKEEIRWGRTRVAAIEAGFSRAFPSIRDSNVSSLITCAILYWFGTGPVRGFAITLAIGIIVSLFTAVIVTRTFLRTFERA